jgi:hypothetical protein
MSTTGTYVVTIGDKAFPLQGIVEPFLDVTWHSDHSSATEIGVLEAVLKDVGTALCVTPVSFEQRVTERIAAICVGELAPLAGLIETSKARVTDLAINTNAGIYRFGFCCELAGHALKPYGVPLAAFGLITVYLQPPASKAVGARVRRRRTR